MPCKTNCNDCCDCLSPIPNGGTCETACRHFARCKLMFGQQGPETCCQWIPSRFSALPIVAQASPSIANQNFVGGVLNEPPQPSAQAISQEIADIMRATPVPMSDSAAWTIVLWRAVEEATGDRCSISALSVQSLAEHLKSLTARLADAEQRATAAEGERDVLARHYEGKLPPGVFSEYARLDVMWQQLTADLAAAREQLHNVEGSAALLSEQLAAARKDAAALRSTVDCAVNALRDSIIASGNDADTNLMWVTKLRDETRAAEGGTGA